TAFPISISTRRSISCWRTPSHDASLSITSFFPSPPKGRRGAMSVETELSRERLRPRILETEETGRLELKPSPAPPPDLASPPIPPHPPSPPIRRSRSPARIAAAGVGLLILGVIAIDLVEFIDGAFAHGGGLGIAATAAVAAGAGGAAYWLAAELRGLWRLRS